MYLFFFLLVLPNSIKGFNCILTVFNIGEFLLIIYLVIDFVSTGSEYLLSQMVLRNLYNLQIEYLLFHFLSYFVSFLSSPHIPASTLVDILITLSISWFCLSTVSVEFSNALKVILGPSIACHTITFYIIYDKERSWPREMPPEKQQHLGQILGEAKKLPLTASRFSLFMSRGTKRQHGAKIPPPFLS